MIKTNNHCLIKPQHLKTQLVESVSASVEFNQNVGVSVELSCYETVCFSADYCDQMLLKGNKLQTAGKILKLHFRLKKWKKKKGPLFSHFVCQKSIFSILRILVGK